jgi:hypothetical protein
VLVLVELVDVLVVEVDDELVDDVDILVLVELVEVDVIWLYLHAPLT